VGISEGIHKSSVSGSVIVPLTLLVTDDVNVTIFDVSPVPSSNPITKL
jgi:hypothetical protein